MTTNPLSALYFPATRITPTSGAPLLLPLAKLLFYRPAEGPSAIPQPLAAPDLVEAYAPAPLGDDLDHFRRLLKDMQAHAPEYHQAYLSSLAAGKEENPEASWRQVARQLKQIGPAPAAKEGSLWRARLYLALAETHAAAQEELAAGIEVVARREAELLRHLQGEDEEELAALGGLPTAPAADITGREAPLLAAWGQLYLADSNPERPWLLATAQEESAGLLFEEYERATGRRPEKLLTLGLPPLADPGEDFPENRRAWRTSAQEPLTRLGDFLTAAAFAEPGPLSADSRQTAAGLAEAWQEAAASLVGARPQKPAAQEDAPRPAPFTVLSFYRLPGMSFPRLFSLFCRKEEQGSSSGAAGPSSPHAVLAVLRP